MRVRLDVVAAATVVASFAGSLHAHHSLEETYDVRRAVTLTGVVTNVGWVNPHTLLSLEVKGATGETTIWSVELGPPHGMTRSGMGPAVLKQGDEISVDVWLAKDGSPSANGRALRAAGGAVYVASPDLWMSVR